MSKTDITLVSNSSNHPLGIKYILILTFVRPEMKIPTAWFFRTTNGFSWFNSWPYATNCFNQWNYTEPYDHN